MYMKVIEVESIEDVCLEVNDTHTRSWEELESVEHNFPTIDNKDDYMIIKHKGEPIAKIVSDSG